MWFALTGSSFEHTVNGLSLASNLLYTYLTLFHTSTPCTHTLTAAVE